MATAVTSLGSFDRTSLSSRSFTWFWLGALAAYGVGDIVTTVALVWFSPLYVEANPVVSEAIALFGGGGFLAVKLLVFYGCIGLSAWGARAWEDPVVCFGPPAILALAGLATTGHNIGLLL